MARLPILATVLLFSTATNLAVGQPALKASAASITASGDAEATALVTVENPTMYDVYILGAESSIAASVEFRDATTAPASSLEELTIPAFGTLEMALTSVHLVLKGLKKPLTAGDDVEIVLRTDGGDRLTVVARVKNDVL